MADIRVFLLCIQTLFIQSAWSRCIAPAANCGCSFAPVASSGGSFVVTSSSPVAPTGVSIVSQNVYEGALVVGGDLPMLGSVGVEGEICTAGAGAVSYGCGDDSTAIVAEDGPIVTGIVAPVTSYAPYAIAPGYAPYFGGYYGFGNGFGFPGFYGYGYGFTPAYGCY